VTLGRGDAKIVAPQWRAVARNVMHPYRYQTQVVVMRNSIARFATALVFVSAGFLRAQTAGDAQRAQPSDTRWSPWLGCWQTADANAPITCIVPTTRASAVDVVTVVDGQVDSRQRIDADGQAHPIDRAGCRGRETVTWSPTGHRVYRRDDLVCPGGVNGISTTLMAISPAGEWLNIEGVRAGAGSLERLDRFHDAGLPSTIPKDIRTAIAKRQLAITTARAAAAAPITEADVIEANAQVEPGVVRSWLAESGVSASVAEMVAPQRQAQPTMQQEPGTPYAESAPCTPNACYAPNSYSPYNGYSVYPYGVYPSFYGTPVYGYPAPLIIVHGSNRPPVHVGHETPRHGPGREPGRTQPFAAPPPRHEPPRHIPTSRIRP
jgi:hypothetical protein